MQINFSLKRVNPGMGRGQLSWILRCRTTHLVPISYLKYKINNILLYMWYVNLIWKRRQMFKWKKLRSRTTRRNHQALHSDTWWWSWWRQPQQRTQRWWWRTWWWWWCWAAEQNTENWEDGPPGWPSSSPGQNSSSSRSSFIIIMLKEFFTLFLVIRDTRQCHGDKPDCPCSFIGCQSASLASTVNSLITIDLGHNWLNFIQAPNNINQLKMERLLLVVLISRTPSYVVSKRMGRPPHLVAEIAGIFQPLNVFLHVFHYVRFSLWGVITNSARISLFNSFNHWLNFCHCSRADIYSLLSLCIYWINPPRRYFGLLFYIC